MLPVLEQLLVLQDRDSRITRLKQEAARIPAELAAVDARIEQETKKFGSMRDDLKHVEAARKKLEIDADSKRTQIDKWRGQLTQIKSNVEYQALLKEIAKAESDINEIEDRELELMEQAEQRQPHLKAEQAELKEITARGEVERSTLKKRTEAIKLELDKLEHDRAALAANVDPDVLARYQRIFRSKGDLAIAPVHGTNCGGCHLSLPPQVVNDAKGGLELTNCSYCGRLLYWPSE